MKKITIILLAVLFLSGCATYKFQKPTASGTRGYLACYDGKPILEYTVGKEKSLPDLNLAKERFKRRRPTVEHYCKQMGQIEPRLKAYFWDPPVMIAGFLGGVLRWPFIAVADYKYNHNPKYKARVDKLDEDKEALEAARVDGLRKKLAAYIAEDISKESLPEPLTASSAAIKEEPVAMPVIEPAPLVQAPPEIKPAVVKEAPVAKAVSGSPVAVIIAQPAKGYSPLKVNFSAVKSYSKSGKIVSYLWDFGDGDISTKKNTENIFWSTTFGARNFTVTLTVRDDTGNTSIASAIIEVITK
ncbi:MAG: PKD domain-containing protein [Candidatus Omnitrophica bacterium]|nr:PKD domain-containing protein [Candidatus Omnitrophota bacterium]MBU4303797.1 PKD domain-containing protein [Candidatus Omnitrophota bacterium]MBU4468605.1 PKD domain-containing protein [Candidatus Omnitrophota bacterium]MCG2708675.1 PKD domain-containing protein [Candidatus Omnitrophota bacterium]